MVAGSPAPDAQSVLPWLATTEMILRASCAGAWLPSMASVSPTWFTVPAAQLHPAALLSTMLLAHAPPSAGDVTVHVQPPTVVVAAALPLWQKGWPESTMMVSVAGELPAMLDTVGVMAMEIPTMFCPATNGLGLLLTVPMFSNGPVQTTKAII